MESNNTGRNGEKRQWDLPGFIRRFFRVGKKGLGAHLEECSLGVISQRRSANGICGERVRRSVISSLGGVNQRASNKGSEAVRVKRKRPGGGLLGKIQGKLHSLGRGPRGKHPVRYLGVLSMRNKPAKNREPRGTVFSRGFPIRKLDTRDGTWGVFRPDEYKGALGKRS